MRREADKVIKEAGICQACWGVQMVRPGRRGSAVLVQHGYKRPGSGRIVGGCIGVDHPPYELSCELVIKIRDAQIRWVGDASKALEDLMSGKRREFYVDDKEKPLMGTRVDFRGRRVETVVGYKPRMVSLDATDSVERIKAENKRQSLIRSLGTELSKTLEEIEFRNRTIDEWKLRPIREWASYEEERKRKGAPKEVPSYIGALLLKMTHKGKGVVPFSVLKPTLELLGWSAEPTVNAVKPRSLYDAREDLAELFGPEVAHITPTEHAIHVVFKSMDAALAAHSKLHVGKPPPREDRHVGDFYFEQVGPVMQDARAYQHHEPGPGFAVSKVWQALAGASFTSPRVSSGSGGANEFSFTVDRYKGSIHNDIVPQGFWTWAYRLGLDEDAEAYLKEHASKPTIEESDDEEGRLVDPRPLEDFG